MSKNYFTTLKFHKSVDAPQKLEDSRAEIAFVGRSNVGKSSLLNSLCYRRKLAKISNTPGKTRAINVFSALNAKWIVDLPGYGFVASVSKKEQRGWKHMLELYLSSRPMLKAVFVLVDASINATKLDLQMLNWLASIEIPSYVVANKIDRIPQTKLARKCRELANGLGCPQEDIAWVSAKKGTGVARLRFFLSSVIEL